MKMGAKHQNQDRPCCCTRDLCASCTRCLVPQLKWGVITDAQLSMWSTCTLHIDLRGPCAQQQWGAPERSGSSRARGRRRGRPRRSGRPWCPAATLSCQTRAAAGRARAGQSKTPARHADITVMSPGTHHACLLGYAGLCGPAGSLACRMHGGRLQQGACLHDAVVGVVLLCVVCLAKSQRLSTCPLQTAALTSASICNMQKKLTNTDMI